jgi:excisionase family DNA binding protein
MTTGAVRPGSMLFDPADVGLAAWAFGELIRLRRTRGEVVPSELVRLSEVTRAAIAIDSPAGPLTCEVIDSASPISPILAEAAPSTSEGLTVTVARMIERSEPRVRQLVADGRLPARRTGARALLIDRDGVAAYLTRREQGAA